MSFYAATTSSNSNQETSQVNNVKDKSLITINTNGDLHEHSKSVESSQTTMMQMLTPSDSDARGFAYGGCILAWVDVCAGIAASKHAGLPCVTASVDSVHFLSPVKVSDICIITASVNRSWRTSLEVGVIVESENMISGERRFCCHAYLTFVAMKDGSPCPVPKLIPQTKDELKRYDEADLRRQLRFEKKNKVKKVPTSIVPTADSLSSPTSSSNKPILFSSLESKPKFEEMASDTISDNSLQNASIPSSVNVKESDSDFSQVITAQKTIAQVLEIVFPQHANSLNVTFGGQIIKWMEYCAAMAASRVCRSHLLTASIDSLNFLLPTRVGDVVSVRGIASASFDHSVEVYVTVSIETLEGQGSITNDGWITFVSVKENGELNQVKKVIPDSQDSFERMQDALVRKQKRLKERKAIIEYELNGGGKK